MLNIVTALYEEAKPIIKHFNLKPNMQLYQNNYINLTITGSGKIKSAIKTSLLLNRYKYKTLNIGISGSSKHEINKGFFIHKITDFDTSFNYYPDFFENNSEEIVCVSKIGEYFPLVDMESSGFFEAAYSFLNVDQIILYKIVSDTPEDKNFDINHLISSHLEVIEELLDEEKDNNINLEIESIINKMTLTHSMKSELITLLKYHYTKYGKLPPLPPTKTKKESKEFITSLYSSLGI